MTYLIHATHLGIYGIILKQDSILLIQKNRGPYKGKLDLPGGKPEFGETIMQTLSREVFEETGVRTHKAQLFANYSTVAYHLLEENPHTAIHHLGMVYRITEYDENLLNTIPDKQDSDGAHYYSFESLTEEMLSPFAYQAIINITKKTA